VKRRSSARATSALTLYITVSTTCWSSQDGTVQRPLREAYAHLGEPPGLGVLGGVAAQDLQTRLPQNVGDRHLRRLQRTRQCFSGCPVAARQGAPGGEGEAADEKGLEGGTVALTGGCCCIVNAVLQGMTREVTDFCWGRPLLRRM
jgi:hypothetical protein